MSRWAYRFCHRIYAEPSTIVHNIYAIDKIHRSMNQWWTMGIAHNTLEECSSFYFCARWNRGRIIRIEIFTTSFFLSSFLFLFSFANFPLLSPHSTDNWDEYNFNHNFKFLDPIFENKSNYDKTIVKPSKRNIRKRLLRFVVGKLTLNKIPILQISNEYRHNNITK